MTTSLPTTHDLQLSLGELGEVGTTTVPSEGSLPVAVYNQASVKVVVVGVVICATLYQSSARGLATAAEGLTGMIAVSALTGGTYGGCGPATCRAGGWYSGPWSRSAGLCR
jgi:hypothetical protein